MSKKSAAAKADVAGSDAGTPQGGGAGTGTASLEIAEGFDPNAARKAVFARYRQGSQAEREIALETIPGAAELQAGYDQGEVAYTEDGDTSGDAAVQSARVPEPAVAAAGAPVVESPQPSSTPEMVELTVFGEKVYKPKTEVEAAGGVMAMQLLLASEHRAAQGRFEDAKKLSTRAALAARDASDKERILQSKMRDLTRPPQPAAPAQPVSTMRGEQPNSPPPATPNQAPAAQDVRSTAKKMVEGLWSGEPEMAEKAVEEVLASLQRPGAQAQVDPGKIAELVVAKVERDLAAKRAVELQEQERVAVNDLMRSDQFKPIMENPAVRNFALLRYNQAALDKRNEGRSKVEIANEVANEVLSTMGHTPTAGSTQAAQVQSEVSARTSFKRRLPTPSSASERAPAEEREARFPTKPTDIVNLLRSARHQQPY